MSTKYHDIVVAKKYEVEQDGQPVVRTGWNRIGRAWKSRTTDSINFELYMFPNQLYTIALQERDESPQADSEDAPF